MMRIRKMRTITKMNRHHVPLEGRVDQHPVQVQQVLRQGQQVLRHRLSPNQSLKKTLLGWLITVLMMMVQNGQKMKMARGITANQMNLNGPNGLSDSLL